MGREILVRDRVGSRKEFPVDEILEQGRREDLAGVAQPGDGQAQIVRMAEELRIDLGRGQGVRRGRADRAARLRSQKAGIRVTPCVGSTPETSLSR